MMFHPGENEGRTISGDMEDLVSSSHRIGWCSLKTTVNFERVANYVLAEIVAVYLAIIGFAVNVSSGKTTAMILAFAVCLVATPLYLWRMGKGSKVKAVHLIVSSIAFVFWAFAAGGARGIFGVDGLNIYDPSWASIALVILTLAVG